MTKGEMLMTDARLGFARRDKPWKPIFSKKNINWVIFQNKIIKFGG
jgi:hypothetical protein